MEFSQLIKDRYSVRKFEARPVEEDKIQALLEAARVAPTAVNKQPWRILVLRSPESLAQLKGCTPYTFEAPLALAVCAVKGEAWVRSYDGQSSEVIDAAIIGTHVMLAAHDLGLGATWVGHFDPAAFSKIYNLPETLAPVAIFPLGYPAAEAKLAPPHEKRRPLADMVVYDRF